MPPRRSLNPAFAAAHGLTDNGTGEDVPVDAPVANASPKRLELLLKEARASGKLQAANVGLKAPLPDALFDFRAGIVVDLSMMDLNSDKSAANAEFVHGEETVTLVDLSDNDLSGSFLDERILRYEQVQIVRWKRCGLASMGQVNLSSLEQLAVLDLAGNQLVDFSLDWLPERLQELNLSHNCLTKLAFSGAGEGGRAHSKDHLLSIDLSHNQLDTLDFMTHEGLSLSRLKSFYCQHNRIKKVSFDQALGSSKNSLQIVDLSHNQIIQGADDSDSQRLDLSNFALLQTVLLSFNRLTNTPCIPLSVVRLDLTTNKIESIRGMFPAVPITATSPTKPAFLVELLLQDNYLLDLDTETIANCIHLQRLDLSANKLQMLPYQLGFLPKLQHLSVTGNPLHTFKTSEMESTKAMMEKLRNRAPECDAIKTKCSILTSSSSVLVNSNRTIQLAGKGVDLKQLVLELKASPKLAFDITGQLVLDKNQLHSIPDDLLPLLPNLTDLSFQGNNLTALPPSLATSCPHLTRISLSSNRIIQVDDIFQASSPILPVLLPWAHTLTHLDLSSNRLTKISGDILMHLPNLEVLSLTFNKLTSLDDWYCLPKALVRLDVSENSLEQVDGLILLLGAHCPRLEGLFLNSNHIHRIPMTIGILQETCPSLKWLNLKGNPQQAVRSEILVKQTQDQLVYFMNRLTVEQKATAKAQMDELLKPNKMQKPTVTPVKAPAAIGDDPMNDDGQLACTVMTIDKNEESFPPSAEDDETAKLKTAISVFRGNIAEFENQLENSSLSAAKRYAVKKELAMERSKLIREERKLGLEK